MIKCVHVTVEVIGPVEMWKCENVKMWNLGGGTTRRNTLFLHISTLTVARTATDRATSTSPIQETPAAARQRMEQILADKHVPNVAKEKKGTNRKKRVNKKQATGA